MPRKKDSAILAFLLIFACIWLGYFTFLVLPFQRYLFPAAAITAIFVGKLCDDLLAAFWASRHEFSNDLHQIKLAGFALNPRALTSLGTLVALVSLMLLTGYQLENTVRSDVLDTAGKEADLIHTPPQFESPFRMADFLNAKIDKNAVIETWERELGILTDHRYHYVDQSLLASTTRYIFHGGPRDYALGEEYFNRIRPAYVIVGWFARYLQVYDTDYLESHGTLVTSIGDGEWRYDVYQLQYSN